MRGCEDTTCKDKHYCTLYGRQHDTLVISTRFIGSGKCLMFKKKYVEPKILRVLKNIIRKTIIFYIAWIISALIVRT